jgi:LysM repeat protein
MKIPARHVALLLLIGLFIAIFSTGCTLAGANAAPLTPVASGGDAATTDEQPTGSEETGAEEGTGAGETVPTPTEMAPIDFFGTQTAEAPPPEPTEEPTQEEPSGEGEEGVIVEEGGTEETGEESAAEETPEPVETQEPATDDGAGGGSVACPATHTVQAGENLFRIAQKYGLTTQQLASANGITNPDQLVTGTQLSIPGCGGTSASTGSTGSTTYTVQPGDNLYRIALKYNMTWQQLAQFNGIGNADDIEAGQVLQIP